MKSDHVGDILHRPNLAERLTSHFPADARTAGDGQWAPYWNEIVPEQPGQSSQPFKSFRDICGRAGETKRERHRSACRRHAAAVQDKPLSLRHVSARCQQPWPKYTARVVDEGHKGRCNTGFRIGIA